MSLQLVHENFDDVRRKLWELHHSSIRELEVEEGILASARNENYGCIFGRDSLITALALLRVYDNTRDRYFLDLVRKILRNLATLQGTKVVIESGEEPGKMIHEYRPDKHEHLTAQQERPWYVYHDGTMRNYDTVDATPLFLMALHEYHRLGGDRDVVEQLVRHAQAALRWILEYGDANNDGFIDYSFHPDRETGGLVVQSWMDSNESIFFEGSSERPSYPIAPVEAQAYTFVALSAWSDFFAQRDSDFAQTLSERAQILKERFNRRFVRKIRKYVTLYAAIDGEGRALTSARSSMGHCLYAVWKTPDGKVESILEDRFVEPVVRRLLARDLFVPNAGIRTLSSRSSRYKAVSYHNGSIWPHDTAIVAEGFANFGFIEEADRVRAAILASSMHFSTSIELFAYTRGSYCEYIDENGRGACRTQAWSAASVLATLARLHHREAPYMPVT